MSAAIAAKLVQPNHRLDFLPKHCEQYHMSFELGVYRVMDLACPDYSGGFWHFYEVSNGGFFIALDRDSPVHLIWQDNYFNSEMSAQAAGIAVSLMILSDLAFSCDAERFSDKFHLLREFALDHTEAGLIFGFID